MPENSGFDAIRTGTFDKLAIVGRQYNQVNYEATRWEKRKFQGFFFHVKEFDLGNLFH